MNFVEQLNPLRSIAVGILIKLKARVADSACHCDCQMLSTMRRQIFEFCAQISRISTILSLTTRTDNGSMSPMGHQMLTDDVRREPGLLTQLVRSFIINRNVYTEDVVERYGYDKSCRVDR